MEKEAFFSIYDLLIACYAISMVLLTWFFFFNQKNIAYVLELKEQISRLETEHQKELAKATLKAQEAEKFRLGQNLHDDLGHTLASLKLTIDMPVYETLDQASFDKFKITCKVLLDKIIGNIRSISHNLAPASIQLYGLSPALEEMVETINKTGSLEVNFRNEAQDILESMEQNTALSLLRVQEELLTNTIKHAQAKNVLISFFSRDRSLCILYTDDGKGMGSSAKKGLGLQNIDNRLRLINAHYIITSAPEAGFTIKITLHPLLKTA